MLELVFLPISADKVRGSARKRGSQIPYRMVKSRVVSHPVRNLGVKKWWVQGVNERLFVREASFATGCFAGILFCPGGDATHR